MNLVMTGDGAFIEVQGTAEAQPFSAAQLARLTDARQRGDRGARPRGSASRLRRAPASGDPGRRHRQPRQAARAAGPARRSGARPALARRLPRRCRRWPRTATPTSPTPAPRRTRWRAHTGLPALADDSGLEVDALGGAAGRALGALRRAMPAPARRRRQRRPPARAPARRSGGAPRRALPLRRWSSPAPTVASWSPRALRGPHRRRARAAAAASATTRCSSIRRRAHLRRAERRGEGSRQPPRPGDRARCGRRLPRPFSRAPVRPRARRAHWLTRSGAARSSATVRRLALISPHPSVSPGARGEMTGRSAAWLAHLPWEQGVGRSNRLAPTIPRARHRRQ